MMFDIQRARDFVMSVDLSGIAHNFSNSDERSRDVSDDDTGEQVAVQVFDSAKSQAQVVGAGVFSFAQGVTPEVRAAISDSALLAQMVANKNVSQETDPIAWFKAYFDVLQNIGWTVQDSSWNDYTATGTAVQVNEKIFEVMSAVLGAAPAALAVLKATVDALKGMDPKGSWMTIFNRESQKARIARFQVGLVEKEQAGDVFVSMLACIVEAHSDLTQVLFFKYKTAGASFKANSGKVSIHPSLTDLQPRIRDKIRSFQTDYLSSIVNL